MSDVCVSSTSFELICVPASIDFKNGKSRIFETAYVTKQLLRKINDKRTRVVIVRNLSRGSGRTYFLLDRKPSTIVLSLSIVSVPTGSSITMRVNNSGNIYTPRFRNTKHGNIFLLTL